MPELGLRAWLEVLADVEAFIPARQVLDRLPDDGQETPSDPDPIEMATTWRERLWLVPGETRLGVNEVAEAMNKSRSWIYRHTSQKALREFGASPLPHRILEGSLTFVAGELRTWIRDTEQGIHELSISSTPAERRSGGATICR